MATYDIYRESHPWTEPGKLGSETVDRGLGKELGTSEASKLFLQRGVLPAFAVLSYTFPSIEEDAAVNLFEYPRNASQSGNFPPKKVGPGKFKDLSVAQLFGDVFLIFSMAFVKPEHDTAGVAADDGVALTTRPRTGGALWKVG